MKKREPPIRGRTRSVRAQLERYACPTVYIVVMHSAVTQRQSWAGSTPWRSWTMCVWNLLKDARLSRFESYGSPSRLLARMNFRSATR